MRRYWNCLYRLMSLPTRRRTIARRRPRTRLRLERLEDRTVPTIVFEPQFGNESVKYNQGPVLNDAPVYLIFWGSYWNTPAGLAGLEGSGTIYWLPSSSPTGGVTYLEVEGGSGGNTFNIENTSDFYYWTYLSTGTGNDTVNVYATTGFLYDYNPGGYDSTFVGLGNMTGINGSVDVFGNGSTYLYLNDSSDSTGRTVAMTNDSVSGLGEVQARSTGPPRPLRRAASPTLMSMAARATTSSTSMAPATFTTTLISTPAPATTRSMSMLREGIFIITTNRLLVVLIVPLASLKRQRRAAWPFAGASGSDGARPNSAATFFRGTSRTALQLKPRCDRMCERTVIPVIAPWPGGQLWITT